MGEERTQTEPKEDLLKYVSAELPLITYDNKDNKINRDNKENDDFSRKRLISSESGANITCKDLLKKKRYADELKQQIDIAKQKKEEEKQRQMEIDLKLEQKVNIEIQYEIKDDKNKLKKMNSSKYKDIYGTTNENKGDTSINSNLKDINNVNNNVNTSMNIPVD